MVELPLTQAQLEILNIDWPVIEANAPKVKLSMKVGGKTREVDASVRHSGAVFDTKNQLATLVVDIGDDKVLPGLYVEADIEGAERDDVIVINEDAFHDKRFVLVADEENRLQFRDARFLAREGGQLLLAADVKPGERVIIDRIPLATPGQLVSPTVHVEVETNTGAQP